MKKMMQWVLAATLVSGASVFTSCSSDQDNPSPEQKKNRTEFVTHCREDLKELAENLNFSSWEVANSINSKFNEYVLNNPEFEKTISALFALQMLQSIQPVEEGSELAQMGYASYAVVDLTQFNYRFTVKDDLTGFDIEPAEDFEMITPGMNLFTHQVEPGLMKLTLKAGGSSFLVLMKPLCHDTFAVVGKIPTEFAYAIASKGTGDWSDIFTGTFNNDVTMSGQSQFINRLTDAFTVSGTLNTNLLNLSPDLPGDATTVNFSIGQDPLTHEGSIELGYFHNGKEMLKLSGVMENLNGMTDYTKLNTNISIGDAFITIMAGNNIKQATITILDDLITEAKVSDCEKVVQLQQAMARARRNYADQQTIDGYTQQLNALVSSSMTCKHHSMSIPMQLQTIKFGVDYWAVPALNFPDEKAYVPITDLLDPESIQYMINIADHAADPMQQSMIVIRQLVQYIGTLTGMYKEKFEQPLSSSPL